jgi:8-oxo-dGTP pyrophosphatase MutT (NUDIX family)
MIINLTEDEIAYRLDEAAQRPAALDPTYQVTFPPGFHPEPPRPAAVLVPFIQVEDAWEVLYTRRTDTLPEHRGQVAFPGGRSDPGDATPEATALREAYEEIGLSPFNVRILGKLAPFLTVTNYMLTPVIGRLIDWPVPLQLEEVEVKRVFTIPLIWLADPVHREVRMRTFPFPHAPLPVFYYELYNGELLWGISAQITVQLLQTLGLE